MKVIQRTFVKSVSLASTETACTRPSPLRPTSVLMSRCFRVAAATLNVCVGSTLSELASLACSYPNKIVCVQELSQSICAHSVCDIHQVFVGLSDVRRRVGMLIPKTLASVVLEHKSSHCFYGLRFADFHITSVHIRNNAGSTLG